MEIRTPLRAAILCLMVCGGGVGIPRNFCKTRNTRMCENVYLWKEESGDFVSLFDVPLMHEPSYNYSALRGHNVRVIADNMLPYITSSNRSMALGGFLGDIWQLIENALGFKSNVTSVYYDTGLQIITTGRADIMLAAVVEKEGLLNVKYSQPYFYNWYHLFCRRPKERASSSSYLKTFDGQLWLMVLTIFVVLTMSLWLTIKLLNSVRKTEPYISIASCFLGTTSGFLNQGFDLKLSSYSGRMQVIWALILGVVLYSAMNAVLVAQLAVFDIPFPFVSVDDIAHRRTHSLCLRSNSFVYNNFTDGNRQPLPKWRGILNGPRCLDINNQTNLARILCNGDLLILENRVVMETILRNYEIPCQIVDNKKKMFKKANSFLMLKSLKHKKLIDGMVKKMRSTGILQRLQDKWVRREKFINMNVPHSPQVTLEHIDGLLLIYGVATIVSLSMLVAEIAYHRSTAHKRDRGLRDNALFYVK